MNEAEGLEYLQKDGNLSVPCSRYGRNTFECAPVAWQVATILANETGEPLTVESLDYAMGLVVNDHDDIEYLIENYSDRQPDDFARYQQNGTWTGD